MKSKSQKNVYKKRLKSKHLAWVKSYLILIARIGEDIIMVYEQMKKSK